MKFVDYLKDEDHKKSIVVIAEEKRNRDLLNGLSPRARAWIRNQAMLNDISHEQVRNKIRDEIKDIYKFRNVGLKLGTELLAWSGKSILCPICHKPLP